MGVDFFDVTHPFGETTATAMTPIAPVAEFAIHGVNVARAAVARIEDAFEPAAMDTLPPFEEDVSGVNIFADFAEAQGSGSRF